MLVLKSILQNLIQDGTLTITDTGGKTYKFSGQNGPSISVKFQGRWLPWHMSLAPTMAIGEGYMDGRLTVDTGTIFDFLALLGKNVEVSGHHSFHLLAERSLRLMRRFQQFNPTIRSRRNVAHHYDLSGELYELFLDVDQQYSCAYFESPETDLETAQELKKGHLADKLLISPGQKILDIGSGWGGMAIFLAKTMGAHVTGITLSEEQLEVSRKRAKEEGVADQVEFYLRDYRDQTGVFDRIISVGMFEHVGIGYFGKYFGKCDNLLANDGIALLHTIGRNGPPSVTDPWIRKYIFPGGYIPSLSEVLPIIEKTEMFVTDIEFLGPHYAETIRHWRTRFQANRDKIKKIFDEKFCRMWEFYLAISEVSFRYTGLTVFQIQMAKRNGIVPRTRDYIGEIRNGVEDSRTSARQAA